MELCKIETVCFIAAVSAGQVLISEDASEHVQVIYERHCCWYW